MTSHGVLPEELYPDNFSILVALQDQSETHTKEYFLKSKWLSQVRKVSRSPR